MRSYMLRSLLSFLSALLIVGCSESTNRGDIRPPEDPVGATELKTTKQSSIDTPELTLFQNAKHYYQVGLFTQARESFEAIRDAYPLGPYAEFAEIKVADTTFETYDFAGAALLYEDFIKNHPAALATPYMLMRAGRSYQLSQRGLGRDVSSLQKAVELYDQLLSRYPQSVYADTAKSLRSEAQDRIAAHEKMVIDFYRQKDRSEAYTARDKAFEDRWGKKSSDFVYMEPDSDEEAPPPPVKHLVTNSSPEQPPQVLVASRLVESKNDSKSLSPVRSAQADIVGGGTLKGVECRKTEQMLFLFLNSALSDQDVSKISQSFSQKDNIFELRVPGLSTGADKDLIRDCFIEKDLAIQPNGLIRLKTQAKNAQILNLENPPRLLVSF